MRIQKFFFLSLLTSCCTMYDRDFECPPPKGVCYAPVSKLEAMIVESPCGEDIFTGCIPKLSEKNSPSPCKNARSEESPEPFQRRIWIASKGECPTYIYFDEDISCPEE